MSGPRVLVVLGYSSGGGGGLHPVCAARVARAAEEAGEGDVVLLSGWARRPGAPSEARLMHAAWPGGGGRLLLDDGSTHTHENALHVGALARREGAREVVVVTSAWHAPRARALLAWTMRGTGIPVRVVSAEGPRPRGALVREALVWPLAPVQVALGRRPRRRRGR
ncbi:MAG: YdcF family protein [Thermoleophilia bacterium]